MPTKKLTDFSVRAAQAPATGRLELWDAVVPGFGLRVTDKDARSWFVMYRITTTGGRRQRRLKIGDATIVSLATARETARDALRQAARGIDPAEERRPALAATGDSVRTAAADYLARYVEKNTRSSTYRETKRIFNVDVLPLWGERPLASITRRDVNELLDKIAARGAEIQVNRILARLKTFFGWAVDQEIIAISPVMRMKPRTREIARDRALSDDEISLFWQGCEAIGWPFGPLFQLLLVTAQRRDEVGGMMSAEVDHANDVWIIPRERAKNDRAHEVALSRLTCELIKNALASRPATDELKNSPFIFTTTGETPVSGFSRAKRALDIEIEKLARKARGLPADDEKFRVALKLKPNDDLPRFVPDWTLHDLRRTAATGMAKMNIPPHVVDRILNHVSGTIRGVAAVYNRHAYAEERKRALDAWSRRIEALLHSNGSNIVALRA